MRKHVNVLSSAHQQQKHAEDYCANDGLADAASCIDGACAEHAKDGS